MRDETTGGETEADGRSAEEPRRAADPAGRAGSRLARSGSPLRFLLLESMVVVISVLVALAVDEWRDAREDQARARAAMADVVEEVRANLRELAYTDSVTRLRVDSLQALRPLVDGSAPFADYPAPGYYTPDLSRAAWERASGDLGAEVPPGFLADAFPVYRGAEILSGLEERVLDLVFSPLWYDPARAPVVLRLSEDLLSQQRSWIAVFAARMETFLDRWAEEDRRP